jgi:hypothetical protein
MDGEQMRMTERGKDARLTLEARQPLAARRQQRRQNLERHVAPQLRVVSAMDFAHPTGAQQLDDLIRAEAITALKGTVDQSVDGRPFERGPRGLMRGQQRLHFGAQGGILAAGLVQKRRST